MYQIIVNNYPFKQKILIFFYVIFEKVKQINS